MNLRSVYDSVSAVLDGIDFGELYCGFHRYGMALYNADEACVDGNMIPRPDVFMGNTAVNYDCRYIAIWDIDLDPVDDPKLLAYHMVHEMFHCHQFANGESRYPDDLALLNYPDDALNFTRKYREDLCLADALEHKNAEKLREFAAIRALRAETFPAAVREELKTETIEGMAEYVGLCALRRIAPDKFDSVLDGYLDILREDGELLFNVRKMCYYSGAVFFLCLEMSDIPVRNDFTGSATAYESVSIDISGVSVDVSPSETVERGFLAYKKKKEAAVAAHTANSAYTECRARICGYDPMNMLRSGDLIYCSHFVFLKCGDEIKRILFPVVLKVAPGSDRDVIGYYI